jgi:late competence protein required for DNA uptake (superfamily II DNA/RNA helicase)
MKCDRCSGMMIHEEFFGPNGSFFSWRCLICGEVVDQTILENRDHQNHGGEWDRRGKKSER